MDIKCPVCNVPELSPDHLLYIRVNKVHTDGEWWSHCMHCHHWFSNTRIEDTCKSDCYCYTVYPYHQVGYVSKAFDDRPQSKQHDPHH